MVLYTALPILEIDGQPAPQDLMEDILQISVEESLHMPGMFTLVINNPYFPGGENDKPWQHEGLFAIGKPIKLGFISSTTKATEFSQESQGYVLEGEITAIETHFTSQSQAPLVIRGYDVAHRLHRGRYNRSFQNMTDSDIVNKVIGEVGIAAGTIDSSGGPYGYGDINGANGYVFQENQTNMEFLRERAARLGFELFVQDGKLNFRKPKAGDQLDLKWLKDIHSFRVRVTSAEQVSSVEVRGWDYQNKQPIVSTKKSQTAQVITDTKQGKGEATSGKFSTKPNLAVVDQPVFSGDEADKIAQALFNELGGEFVHADAKAEGNPKIRPGRVVNVSDMGKYSGKYYVTETRHFFHERVYSTEFSVQGLRGEDLLTTLSPPRHLQPGQTLLVGIVTNNQDPLGWGRVRVKFPTLTEEHESNWARVVAIGAGTLRGFDCLPEINDEVLVAFEHGDIHRPYVIGGVWNGRDATPEPVGESVVGGKVRLRTFQTRTGHKLQFVEEDKGSSKKGVYLDTVYGHQLHVNDTEKFIEAKTKNGHQVRLDDQNKKILIHTNGGHTCELSDQTRKISISSTGEINMTAPQKINLSVGASSIEVTPMNVTIKAGPHTIEVGAAGITIQAAGMAKLSGVTTTVQGAAVVTLSAPAVSLG